MSMLKTHTFKEQNGDRQYIRQTQRQLEAGIRATKEVAQVLFHS